MYWVLSPLNFSLTRWLDGSTQIILRILRSGEVEKVQATKKHPKSGEIQLYWQNVLGNPSITPFLLFLTPPNFT